MQCNTPIGESVGSQCDAHNAGDYQTRNGDDGSVLDSEILEQIRSRCNAHAGNDESQEGELPIDNKGNIKKMPKNAVAYAIPGKAEVILSDGKKTPL